MLKTTSLATLAFLLSSTSVLALEGKALFEDLTKDAKGEITYGSIEETGADSFVLKDVRIVGSNDDISTAKTITFDALREDGGAVLIGAMRAENYVTQGRPPKEGEKQGEVTVRSVSLADVSAPREVFGGDVAKVRGERVKVGSFVVEGVEGDQNGDGKTDFTLGSFKIEALDTPLDWRMDPKSQTSATGEPAAPLTLKAATMTDLKGESPAGSVSIASFQLNDARVPTTPDASPREWARVYSSVKVGAVDFQVGGKKVFGMDAMNATIEPEGETVILSKSAIDGVFVDLASVPDARVRQFAQALGYTTLTGRAEGDGRYDFETGNVEVDKVTLGFDDVAELAMSYTMTGYTPELAKEINELSARAGAGQQAAPAEMMKLLGQLKLGSATLELKDDSITQRVLSFQASQMNTKPEQLAAGAPMIVAMGMAQLGAPEFTQQVSQAVGSFLQQPGTLSVSVQPAAPVPFTQFIEAAQRAPRELIELLNVTVKAVPNG